ncbi:21237_t:CDS:2 [Cetraspora pellucida]|uniref:21237_t:CDS:1 n=1 Tax=Cetraspora pellucida TaxID=1433469 RepID=A0A9N9ESI5_9GLOM|nr:21237_t:CDS:2 [Cetraspora pellucida]
MSNKEITLPKNFDQDSKDQVNNNLQQLSLSNDKSQRFVESLCNIYDEGVRKGRSSNSILNSIDKFLIKNAYKQEDVINLCLHNQTNAIVQYILASFYHFGNKEDLSDRLQAFFGKNKGKATDKSGVGDEDLDDIIKVPRIDADERDWDDGGDADLEKAEQITVDMFLSAMGKIEMKMERNFSALHREIEECDLLDEAWPKVSLSKPCDQHEYDFLTKIGKRLDKAIKVVPMANKKDFDGIRNEIEARAATLRLADNKGWGTALQIVGSNDKMMEKYKDHIPLFSQSGVASCYYSQNKPSKSYRHKRKRYSSPSSDSERNESHKEEPSGSQIVKESLTASTVEALVTSLPAALPQVLELPPSQRMETDYTRTLFVEDSLIHRVLQYIREERAVATIIVPK